MPLFQQPCEKPFFDSIASEINRISGTTVTLFLLKDIQNNTDPLYNEPNKFAWDDFTVQGFLMKPTDVFQENDRGGSVEWDAEVWFGRADLEKVKCPRMPQPGDVVQAWDKYFDIIQHELLGYLDDVNLFTQVRCELKMRTKFQPERKNIV